MSRVLGGHKKKRLGEILVEAGVISEEKIEEALAIQKTRKGQKLGTVLLDLGYIKEQQMVEALKSQLGYESVTLSLVRISDDVIKLVDEPVLRKHNLIPFGFSEKNANLLKVAMSDPLDIRAIDDITIITGFQLEIYVTTQRDIATTIDRYYGNAEALRVAEQFTREQEEANRERAALDEQDDDAVSDAPIVKLVRQIIEQAVRKRASDIHIEPLEGKLRIRFRVDGVLQEEMLHDHALHAAMIARIKIISGLDISEKRKLQDGRATAIVDRQEYDIRVSLLPTVYGEKVVMRLTQKKGLTKDKQHLGFTNEELEKFDKILSRPNGIILVTGPTGSGKSTTLYATLQELNDETKNIITIEDPVERTIEGINQIAVNNKAGLTFATGLRSIVRQDPNIIMVGEIRDGETAKIAVQAALTGHLVFSTLHTNNAIGAVTRLLDIGIEPFLLAAALRGVVAQRLVRTICPYCEGGCDECNHTGYKGRIAVQEVLEITPKLQNMITHVAEESAILEAARENGFTTFKEDCLNKVQAGQTTLEEYYKVACGVM